MDRVWKPVDSAPGYEVSNDGCVRSVDRVIDAKDGRKLKFQGRVLKKGLSGSGYYQVTFSLPSGPKIGLIHRLVAQAFLGGDQKGRVVCHYDGNRLNNHVSNLRFDTYSGNMSDCVRHGTSARGSRNAGSKLREEDVIEIRRLHISGCYTRSDLSRIFGVSENRIGMIITGRAWKHVFGPIAPITPNQGERPGSKLTASDVREIRRFSFQGVRRFELADKYGVSSATISNIVLGKVWRHLV